jgi:hypothetical protein
MDGSTQSTCIFLCPACLVPEGFLSERSSEERRSAERCIPKRRPKRHLAEGRLSKRLSERSPAERVHCDDRTRHELSACRRQAPRSIRVTIYHSRRLCQHSISFVQQILGSPFGQPRVLQTRKYFALKIFILTKFYRHPRSLLAR